MRFDKTVLQVIPALGAGGAERTTVEMTRAIVAAGGRALVATSGGRLAGEVEKAGGRMIILPSIQEPADDPRQSRAPRPAHPVEKIDLIHARSRAPAWSALWAARTPGSAYAATYHGAYKAASPWKRLYNSALARADLVIANSAFTADSIRRQFPVGDRLKVIPRGADLDLFNPERVAPERAAAIRAKWAVENPKAMILLLPGRLTEWKGHRVAIEALALLAKGRRGQTPAGATGDFQLIFAGDEQGRGRFAASLLRLVDELGLSHMIRWVGHCADMPAAYACADVVLSPATLPEAFGRVAVEAGAMRKPTIASDHGGQRETVIDGVTGF